MATFWPEGRIGYFAMEGKRNLPLEFRQGFSSCHVNFVR